MNKYSAKESGSVAIVVAVMMFLLLGIAAFAVDFGYQYVVKNQVQNSADAAALAGADVLFRNAVNPVNFSTSGGSASTTTSCSSVTPITAKAACIAAAAIPFNEYGTNTFAVNVNLWSSLSPAGPNNYPAVKVDLTRTVVPFFFGRVFGQTTTTISASATAITRSAATIGKGTKILPVGINDCVFSGGYDNAVGWTFTINTSYPSVGCDTMKWAGAGYGGEVGASTIAGVITDGSSVQMGLAPGAPGSTTCNPPGDDGVNTCIFMDNGVKNSDYKTLNDYVGQNFTVPVVADVTKGNQPIEALVCARLENVCDSWGYFGNYTGGKPKSTEPNVGPSPPNKCPGNGAYFSLTILNTGCSAGGTGGPGPYYGVTSSPQLAN